MLNRVTPIQANAAPRVAVDHLDGHFLPGVSSSERVGRCRCVAGRRVSTGAGFGIDETNEILSQ